jgi:hypothetical protein
VARDLLLGTTKRDWSCGIDLYLTQDRRREMAQDILSDREVGDLGKLVGDEIQQSYREIVRLNTSRKIPADLRRSFRPLLARWQEFSGPRRGKFAGSDYVALVNFRDENRQFAQQLAAIAASSSTSSSWLSSPWLSRTSPADAPTAPTSLALGATSLLGLCGLSFLTSRLNKNHS